MSNNVQPLTKMNAPQLTRLSPTNNAQLLMKSNVPLPTKLSVTLPAASATDMVDIATLGKDLIYDVPK